VAEIRARTASTLEHHRVARRAEPAMLIRFTRLSNERHRLEVVRADGTRESHELETRSTLLHDLAHYAVEVEAGLEESFYGRLAQGLTYAELTATPPKTSEAIETERVVVLVQNVHSRGDAAVTPEGLVRKIIASFSATESPPPSWLDVDLVARVLERLRRVQGRWRATPFHRTMELAFPVGD
jgi:hypothetical protein